MCVAARAALMGMHGMRPPCRVCLLFLLGCCANALALTHSPMFAVPYAGPQLRCRPALGVAAAPATREVPTETLAAAFAFMSGGRDDLSTLRLLRKHDDGQLRPHGVCAGRDAMAGCHVACPGHCPVHLRHWPLPCVRPASAAASHNVLGQIQYRRTGRPGALHDGRPV